MKIYRNSLNIYDTSQTAWEAAIKDDSGTPTDSTTSHYTTNYTEVQPNTTYYIVGSIGTSEYLHRIYFYDSDKNWISRSTALYPNQRTFTTPATCNYIQLQVYINITSTADWMIYPGTAERPFEPYNVVDWYGYKYKLRASGAWSELDDKKAPWTIAKTRRKKKSV